MLWGPRGGKDCHFLVEEGWVSRLSELGEFLPPPPERTCLREEEDLMRGRTVSPESPLARRIRWRRVSLCARMRVFWQRM
uniref:Uncharacterized protein n=1 Tax=Sphaerodactylus townsendi TaxID=933632 RepID=A0ACB8EMS4_9SAUR